MGVLDTVPLWNQLATVRQGRLKPVDSPSQGSWLSWMACEWCRGTD